MIITLCGSARFERHFHKWNELLSLSGHQVFSIAVYPSQKEGVKNWYSDEQKEILDQVHKMKIEASDGIFVINAEGYIGQSTLSELSYARSRDKLIFWAYREAGPYLSRKAGDGFVQCQDVNCPHDILQPSPCNVCGRRIV